MKNPGTRNCSGRPAHRLPTLGWFWLSFCLLSSAGRAGENVPHRPFAEWAQLPPRGVLEVGAHYQESEAYYFWTADRRYKADFKKGGEHYGIDVNQGYVALQYGIAERWAADLAVGVTTAGWRFFANDGNLNGGSRSTTGLMDVAFGVRYQLCREETAPGSC
ncbi:MAG: hypothetical protein RMK20_06210, partial [Verrucomicrobiales bacterium]|nr:hypothetical protein [Verrucomicrobiales bacterium]